MINTLYDTFKHWSAKGSVYIFSDTHFNDPDCSFMAKDWITPDEQIKIINSMVHKNDTLILLGDVGDIECAKRLNGYKVLIMGNHDVSRTKFEGIFDEIYEGPLMIAEKILLSHEPIYGLPFVLNIHGHCHFDKEKDKDPYHINLAANICNYTPISLGELIKNGALHGIKTIHRTTIDKAAKRKMKRE